MKKSPPIRPGLLLKTNYLVPKNMSASDMAKKAECQ
jgi:plasmid maintenance system antidote protein VapI